MPVQSVKTGVVATYYAALERIGVCAPSQAITKTHKSRKKGLIGHHSLFVFQMVPVAQV